MIKVEPLTGDPTRGNNGKTIISPTFSVINRNKRSIALDLKTPEGVELLLKLAETCDILLQNFRPGVVDRLGIGYEAVKAVKPDIIYVSSSGFGAVGPRAARRVYDPIIQAVSGLASIQADAAGRPKMLRIIVPDKLTAMTSAQAMSTALFKRERTGAGCHVELSMLDAVVSWAWPVRAGAWS